MSAKLGRMAHKRQVKSHGEKRDNHPVEIPVHARINTTLEDKMKAFIRNQMSNYAVETGGTSFQEEDDFTDTQDDPEFLSDVELTDMQADAEMLPPSEDTQTLAQPEEPAVMPLEEGADSSIEPA